MRYIVRIQAAAGASWRPLSVDVMHREPADRTKYEQRIGTRISFSQPANTIRITSPTLNLRVRTADPNLFRLVTEFCEQQLQQQKHYDDALNRAREAISLCVQRGESSPRSVAAELGITPGGLQRLLKQHGTSFKQLLDDTRRRVAVRYLFESSLPLGEIATRVGYSELSAFSRAGRRWFGCSPRKFRQSPTRSE